MPHLEQTYGEGAEEQLIFSKKEPQVQHVLVQGHFHF